MQRSSKSLRLVLCVVPTALGVTLLCWALPMLAPGVSSLAGLAQDGTLPPRHGLWLERVLRGDLGVSMANGQAVAGQVLAALSRTLSLAAVAALIGMVGGSVLGALAGCTQGGVLDRGVRALAVACDSIPPYGLALVLVLLLAAPSGVVPVVDAGPGSDLSWTWDAAQLRLLALPALTLSLVPLGAVTRSVRVRVAEALKPGRIDAGPERGPGAWSRARHAVLHAWPAALTMGGRQLGPLFGASILVETVFAWPGTGRLLHTAIETRDWPLLQGTLLVLGLCVVALDLVVDLLQALPQPHAESS